MPSKFFLLFQSIQNYLFHKSSQITKQEEILPEFNNSYFLYDLRQICHVIISIYMYSIPLNQFIHSETEISTFTAFLYLQTLAQYVTNCIFSMLVK